MRWRFLRWLDGWRLAGRGVILAGGNGWFWATVVVVLVAFGTLLNLLASGTAAWDLFWATDGIGKLGILKDGFLGFLGVGRTLGDFLWVFLIAVLQSVLVGLIVLIWRKKREINRGRRLDKKAKICYHLDDPNRDGVDEAAHVQNAGIVAGLAILAGGCPTCGTALIVPILSALFATGGFALATTVTWGLNILALLIALWALRRAGMDAYAIIIMTQRKHRLNKSDK